MEEAVEFVDVVGRVACVGEELRGLASALAVVIIGANKLTGLMIMRRGPHCAMISVLDEIGAS